MGNKTNFKEVLKSDIERQFYAFKIHEVYFWKIFGFKIIVFSRNGFKKSQQKSK